jgi:hypothetical protein
MLWLPMCVWGNFLDVICVGNVESLEFGGGKEFTIGIRNVGGLDFVGGNVSAQISLPILRRE